MIAMPANPAGEATTTIDSLVELLKERGRMELTKIASTLGVDQSVVEGWCKVLEEGGLCKVTYELGRMYVEPTTVSKEAAKAIEVTAVEESATLETELASERESLDKFVARLQTVSTSVSTAEKIFQERLPELEQQLSGINKIYAALEDENDKLDSVRKKAEEAYNNLNKRITTLQNRIENVDVNVVQAATAEYIKIQDTLKRAEDLEDQLEILSRSKDRALDVIRKSIEDQMKVLNGELNKAERNMDAQIKEHRAEITKSIATLKGQVNSVRQLVGELSNFRKERTALKKSLESTRVSFNDEYAKITSRMDSTSGTLKAEVDMILKSLDALKLNFGEAAKLYDQVETTKREANKTQKAIEELREEFTKMIDELRTVRAMRASAEAKAEVVSRSKGKYRERKQNMDEIDEKIGNLSKTVGGSEKEAE